ncbi:hypothetical protein V866_005151 [Kwoniella sp. B9012]
MPQPNFNLPEYFALHSYLSALLCGASVLLPRSTPWFVGDAAQSSSTDRPEYAFLTPLTSRPLVTMRIGECSASTLVASVVLYVLINALGAPLDSHHLHTFLLSLHVAILTVWPTVHALGVPSIFDSGTYARFRMTRLFCEFRALVYPVIGTLSGAWCGAIPIPLDWDRPWQSYPLTPTVGSILGFIVGGFVSWLHSALIDTADEVLQTKKQAGDMSSEKKKKKRTKRT